LQGASTQMSGVEGIVVGSGGNIHVASSANNSVLIFFPGSQAGNVAPSSSITGSTAGLTTPWGLYLAI
jgi:hypothetical protein